MARLGCSRCPLHAPRALLESLDERKRFVRKNPRGFLENVLRRLLENLDHLVNGTFPSFESLPIRVQEPEGWTEFERRFLGGFSRDNKERVRVLSAAWFSGRADEHLAADLEPLLGPLRLPKFAAEVGPRDPKPEPKPPEPRPPDPRSTDELQELLSELREWSNGEILLSDEEPRDLVRALIVKALPLESIRGLPRGRGYEAPLEQGRHPHRRPACPAPEGSLLCVPRPFRRDSCSSRSTSQAPSPPRLGISGGAGAQASCPSLASQARGRGDPGDATGGARSVPPNPFRSAVALRCRECRIAGRLVFSQTK